jgi:hypothetical protein
MRRLQLLRAYAGFCDRWPNTAAEHWDYLDKSSCSSMIKHDPDDGGISRFMSCSAHVPKLAKRTPLRQLWKKKDQGVPQAVWQQSGWFTSRHGCNPSCVSEEQQRVKSP